MTIRRAVSKDIPRLNALLCQVLNVHHRGRPDLFKGGAKKYTDEELAAIIADDTRPIFVAVDNDDIALGYAFCVYQQYIDNNILTDIKTLYIDDICVDETARGKHIGSELYRHVVGFAKREGFYNITLNVWSCNESAMRFYEKMGLSPYKVCMEQLL